MGSGPHFCSQVPRPCRGPSGAALSLPGGEVTFSFPSSLRIPAGTEPLSRCLFLQGTGGPGSLDMGSPGCGLHSHKWRQRGPAPPTRAVTEQGAPMPRLCLSFPRCPNMHPVSHSEEAPGPGGSSCRGPVPQGQVLTGACCVHGSVHIRPT